ncbi:MAG TPA: transketolase C-terminal domain-containing protein [Candidatus Nanoarchaeia archaeon]|nr:transketolase C-terminal domain-containing protein [Candidatus Nanoarchaeia archaeon]
MRKAVLDCVYELAKKDARVIYIGSDLGAGILDNFKKEMPDRFFMEGVSEQALIGISAGLALSGKIVYFNTIATFITRRCFEQVVLDMCLHHANVRLISNGGGLVYAPLGPTHLAIDDIGILRTIPGMTIIAPCDAEEMKRLMPHTLNYNGPIYIRLAKGGDSIVSLPEKEFTIGRAIVMRECDNLNNALIIATGITTKIAMDAAAELEKQGISATVLHMHTIKPFDKHAVETYAKQAKAVISVEEHTIYGGLGSAVAETLAEANINVKFKILGIPDTFSSDYGSQQSIMEKYGITAKGCVGLIKELMNREN